jgi:curli production assembly/transport component CsgG
MASTRNKIQDVQSVVITHRGFGWLLVAVITAFLNGCAAIADRRPVPSDPLLPAALTPVSGTYHDLVNLPPPRGKVLAAVYGFRDQTGQFKKQPNSNFSTAVTQGAGAMLVRAMLDSGWFVPVEREGLQDLLTERKIIRAALKNKNAEASLPSLMSANVLLEGGIVAYDTNVLTGGLGVRYFGIGASDLYRMDQVTISLRAVDIRTGRVLKNVFTTKTIYSYEVDAGVYRFVSFRRLLEADAGFTRNEPAQLCVLDAIEAAVVHLIVGGIKENLWQLADPKDLDSPIVQAYLREQQDLRERSLPPRQVLPVATDDTSQQSSNWQDLNEEGFPMAGHRTVSLSATALGKLIPWIP